jgi:hypothetical protein
MIRIAGRRWTFSPSLRAFSSYKIEPPPRSLLKAATADELEFDVVVIGGGHAGCEAAAG